MCWKTGENIFISMWTARKYLEISIDSRGAECLLFALSFQFYNFYKMYSMRSVFKKSCGRSTAWARSFGKVGFSKGHMFSCVTIFLNDKALEGQAEVDIFRIWSVKDSEIFATLKK